MRRNGEQGGHRGHRQWSGLPRRNNRNRLLEPYVTTKRNKGTGLGLAIVQKSASNSTAAPSPGGCPGCPGRTHGALLRISLPLGSSPAGQTSSPPERAAASGNA